MPVSVLKRSPPPVAMPLPKKGGGRRLKKEPQEDGEDEEDVEVVEVKRPKEEDDVEVVCPQSFRNELTKEMDLQKEEEDDEDEEEENGVMEVEDESGAEDKEKDMLR